MEKAALIHFDTEDIRLAVRHPDETVRALATQRICREMRDFIGRRAEIFSKVT